MKKAQSKYETNGRTGGAMRGVLPCWKIGKVLGSTQGIPDLENSEGKRETKHHFKQR